MCRVSSANASSAVELFRPLEPAIATKLPGMETGPPIAYVAALVGDPARANMLSALTDGRALTASELAYFAGVTPQTASSHLGKLTEAGLLAQQRQGRHRYYRLASPLVGRMLESLMVVADPARDRPRWRGGEALRTARTCYDHLAGRLAVGIADALVERGHVVLAEDGGAITAAGLAHLAEFGLDLGATAKRRRPFCKPCLDWSERRPHLAGAVGAALAARAFELGWIERIKDSRAVAITAAGHRGFADAFGLRPPPWSDP
jgi:DNA-binding transcriptional ArsR family regulator